MSNTKLWAITILGIAVGWFFYKAAPALQPALIAIVVAYLFNPLVELLERKLKLKKWLAIALLMAMIVGLLVLLMNLILPPVVREATAFINEFDRISRDSNKIVEDVFVFLENQGLSPAIVSELRLQFNQVIQWMGTALIRSLTSILGYILRIVDVFLVLIMVTYFLSSGKTMVQNLVDSTSPPLRQTLLNLLDNTNHVIWSYVRTQFLIAIIVGGLSTLAFLVIGVKFAVLLGVMAGILNFIPYFGSIIAGAVASIVALLTGGFQHAVITLVTILVIQQIEGNLITPRLQGKSIGIHPVAILIIIMTGNYLWGTIGMFIAVPVFGIARLIVAEAVNLIQQMD